jgi:hypothetical protein
MGGWNSGRSGGRPTADAACKIDLAWMLREGLAREGSRIPGTLSWSCGGSPAGSISFTAIMDEPGEERLELSYRRGTGDDAEDVRQTVYLAFTQPHYGGKRWWMVCPFHHIRIGKLYLPPGGDRFASRQAWRLGYHSQRIAGRDKPFEALFRIQKKLGCKQGWEAGLFRPKGMHWRTFNRHFKRYWELDARCTVEMMGVLDRLSGMRNRAMTEGT